MKPEEDAPNHDSEKNSESDALWELLGKARPVEERPFFASKVLQAIRSERSERAEEQSGLMAWLRRRWLMPFATVAFAAVMALVALKPDVAVSPGASDSPASLASTDPGAEFPESEVIAAGGKQDVQDDLVGEMAAVVAENADYQIIAELDDLLAAEDTSIWTDSSSPF